MSKLCVVVPEYSVNTPTHFGYFIPFFDAIRNDVNLSVVAERGQMDFTLDSRHPLFIQKFRFFPFRASEIFFLIFLVRLRGTKDFYVHYSFLAAFVASLIVRVFGGRVFYWNCGIPWQYSRSGVRNFFERRVYRLITYLVTGTEGLAREYIAHYKIPIEKIKVVPNWIDVNRAESVLARISKKDMREKLHIPPGVRVALFVHRLSQRKGAHYLPEIVKNFQNEHVLFLVAGEGPEKEHIERQIKADGTESKIRFAGPVPQREIENYFAAADVFFMPSEEEGFPHVILEAMASRTPFVAFDVGGVKEIAGHSLARFVVPVGDVARLVSEMRKILAASPAELQLLADAESERVRAFDLPLVKRRFIELFI